MTDHDTVNPGSPQDGPHDESAGAEPAGLGLFDSFTEIENFTSDGRFREVTIFEGETPLATLIPFKRPIDTQLLDAPADVAVRLSRFAYLRRVGTVMLLKTPLSGLDLQLHDPRAGALLTALAFEASPAELARRTGVSVDAARRFVGLLCAMSAAEPVAKERDRAAMAAALIDWSLSHGLPASWDSPSVREAIAQLPWDRVTDHSQLIWELHHGDDRRADISLSLSAERGRREPALAEFDIEEYDVTDRGAELMGTFFRVNRAPGMVDPWAWTQQALRATGVQAAGNRHLQDLVAALGAPRFIGVTPRRAGTRVIFEVESAQVAAMIEVLRAAGVPETVLARVPLLTPVMTADRLVRLAVDATPDGLLPSVAFEVFLDARTAALVPGVLDALGLDGAVTAEVLALITADPVTRDLMLAPGVTTDMQRIMPMHVKIAFGVDGRASVKTYLSVDNTSLTSEGRTIEDRMVPATWEFHDLLFHSQVRTGRLRHRIGGTARFSAVPDLVLTDQPPAPGDVPLPRIDIAAAVTSDAPFGEVLRARASDRDWTGPEIPLAKLAELLERVGEVIPRQADFGGIPQDFTGAPYPSGGGLYETDMVVIAHRVGDLEPGAYLYERASRSLRPLVGDPGQIDALLMFAAESTLNGVTRPQALIVLAARFPDIAVKYEGIAYALMVKHVGVLQATIAYTAVAMGLGAVPIGTGDSDSFAQATGLDYYRHGSIGEIAISMPSPSA